MLKILKTRFLQGHRTIAFPKKTVVLPERYRGRPIVAGEGGSLDLGKMTFISDGGVKHSGDFRMATSKREDLVLKGREMKLASALNKEMLKIFGRSLKLRQVSAGGCNACEAELNVLSTVVFDLSRFGIQFVASPRHADGIIVTGPITRNMKEALLTTYAATPDPKIVIAVGACAISGGIFADSPEASKGLDTLIPVDLYIPGCPPHPLTSLDGLLRLLGRMEER
jgi:Ni,Fe-hydrogenase III small subunit